MKKARRGSITAMISRLSSRLTTIIWISAIVSIAAMVFVLYSTNLFLKYSRASVSAAEILEDGLEARLDAFKFRITGNSEISDSFSDNVAETLEVSDMLHENYSLDSETSAALDESERLVTQYSEAFDRIVELRAPRNELVASLVQTGLQIRQELTEIMESAYRDGDPVASIFAGRAQSRILQGRLYMERYLLNNNEDNFSRAMTAFGEANASLEELLPELQNPRRRELAQSARDGISAFVETSDQVFGLITERNGHRATMDTLGPEFIASVEFVMDTLTQKQEAVGIQLRRTGWALILALSAYSAIALYFAKKTSTKTANYIKNSIDKFVAAMTELANGATEIKLDRPPDEGTELARMADALTIFRDNAIERNALQKEQALREKQQAEEREAQLQRDEAAKREAQERVEESRRALLERLEKSVGAVVSHAARGDFSKRITVDFDEVSLRNMADKINQLVENVEAGLGATASVIGALSKGDLSGRMEGNFEGAFQDLQDNTNEMIVSLQSLIAEISGSTVNLSDSSNELRDTATTLTTQAEQNAASLEETSAALKHLAESIKQVSANVTDANDNAQVASDTAQSSRKVATAAADAMTEISDASTEIARVVTVINDIAFQINLLALNAGVEAARAGEAGRGFSVVASEVRQLSQRASDAAQEIDEVIERSSAAVTVGVEKVNNARSSLEKISDSVVGVSTRIDAISNAIEEQVSGVAEINNSVSQIDKNTQKQAASFEELTAASGLLSHEADGLQKSTSRFKTAQEHASTVEEPEVRLSA